MGHFGGKAGIGVNGDDAYIFAFIFGENVGVVAASEVDPDAKYLMVGELIEAGE